MRGWICLRQGAVNCTTHSLVFTTKAFAIKIIVTHQFLVLVILYAPQSQPMLLPRHCPCCDWPVSEWPAILSYVCLCSFLPDGGTSAPSTMMLFQLRSLPWLLVTSCLERSQFSPIPQCPGCGVRADSAVWCLSLLR